MHFPPRKYSSSRVDTIWLNFSGGLTLELALEELYSER